MLDSEITPQRLAEMGEQARRVLEGEGCQGKGGRGKEIEDYEGWLRHYFPSAFTRPFTGYQHEFWRDWAWEIKSGGVYRPRVECEPRGVGKSTNAEAFVVSVLARKRRQTVGYVSRTDDKATQHFASIKRKLETPALLKDYPHLKPRVQTYRNTLSAWAQDRLVTDAGQMVIPVTLLGSKRGFKSEDDVRFDLIILDDIDELGESHMLREKNLELLKSEILAAGAGDDTVILFAQNLIYKDSICSQVLDHKADILSERDFRGPYPMMKWYDAEKVDLPDGAKRWTITAGEVFDPALDVKYCESLLNRYGKDTFDRECQQLVNRVSGDKSFREYDEIYHVITWKEFATVFGRPEIPQRWHKGRGLDWGTTRAHPTAAVYGTKPSKAEPLNDSVFVVGEVVRPAWPFEAHSDAELVSPGRVADAVKTFERENRIAQEQLKKSLMSHEASAAKNSFVIDMPEEKRLFWRKWKARRGSGVPQIQEKLAVDKNKLHPFRRDPQTGEKLRGCPKLFFVVADGQGELYYDPNGQLRVRQPTDGRGLARLRAEMPEYDERATGQEKMFDDAVDALRGMAAEFFVSAAPKTEEEKIEDRLQPGIRRVDIPSLQTKEDKDRAVQSHEFWSRHFRAEDEKAERATERRVVFRR